MSLFLVCLGLVLVGMVTLCVILIAALSAGSACPACGGEAIAVLFPRPLRRVPFIERRWCTSCGWEGLLRRTRPAGARSASADASSPYPV